MLLLRNKAKEYNNRLASFATCLCRQRIGHEWTTHLPGSSPAGGQWCPDPPFEIGAPHFTFGPPVAAYIQYCIFKMWPLLLVFGPPAANPGDGPGTCAKRFEGLAVTTLPGWASRSFLRPCLVPTCLAVYVQKQGRIEGGKGHNSRASDHSGGAEKSQQCHKYFLQYSTLASEIPPVRTWGRQTCFLPRAPSYCVTPLHTPKGLKDILAIFLKTVKYSSWNPLDLSMEP